MSVSESWIGDMNEQVKGCTIRFMAPDTLIIVALHSQSTHLFQAYPDNSTYPSTALVAVANAADPGVTPRSKADLPPVVLLMARAVVSARHETMTMPTAIRIHHR